MAFPLFLLIGLLYSCTLQAAETPLISSPTRDESQHKLEPINDEMNLYPRPPIEDDWPRPKGQPFDKDKLAPQIISAFFYGAGQPPDIDKVKVQSYVEIPYRRHDGHTDILAVVVISLIYKSDNFYFDYIVLFRVSDANTNKYVTKLSEKSLSGGGYHSYASLSLQNCLDEENPFVYLFYESGANSSDFSHKLYQIEWLEEENYYCLRNIWRYSKDYECRSTTKAYQVSNIQFHGFNGQGDKRITIYTTSGIRRPDFADLPPDDLRTQYHKTIYVWDTAQQCFCKK